MSYTISYKQTRVVKRLINLGANVNVACTPTKCSVLLEAVEKDHRQVLPSITEDGADYIAADAEGGNVANNAVKFAYTNTMAVLAGLNLSSLNSTLKDKHGKCLENYFPERAEPVGLDPALQNSW